MSWDHGDWGGPEDWGNSGDWNKPGDWGGGWGRPPMCPGSGGGSQQPRQILQMIEPVAQHGVRELEAGVNPTHTMRQVAAAGYLVGSGYSPRQAIEMVEKWERMGYLT